MLFVFFEHVSRSDSCMPYVLSCVSLVCRSLCVLCAHVFRVVFVSVCSLDRAIGQADGR